MISTEESENKEQGYIENTENHAHKVLHEQMKVMASSLFEFNEKMQCLNDRREILAKKQCAGSLEDKKIYDDFMVKYHILEKNIASKKQEVEKAIRHLLSYEILKTDQAKTLLAPFLKSKKKVISNHERGGDKKRSGKSLSILRMNKL